MEDSQGETSIRHTISPDNAQSKEEAESGISTEEAREEDGAEEEFTPTVDNSKSEEDDKTELVESQYRYPQQQHNDNYGEETESEIPSSILPFLNEP